MLQRTSAKSAFSLVELSIVLVILGLLVGGVLAGQSLIRAAQLRAVTAQVGQYAAASKTFRDKYFALPGDLPNATSFWPVNPSGCPAGGGTIIHLGIYVPCFFGLYSCARSVLCGDLLAKAEAI
jgi:prepilin-type N-terminal cleavage/methylation domain-containing protein